MTAVKLGHGVASKFAQPKPGFLSALCKKGPGKHGCHACFSLRCSCGCHDKEK